MISRTIETLVDSFNSGGIASGCEFCHTDSYNELERSHVRALSDLEAARIDAGRAVAALREKLDTLQLYADLRDALLDDARKALQAAHHRYANGASAYDVLDALLADSRPILAMERAEKAPGEPGDLAAIRAAAQEPQS
jgi:hypothetical protein